MVLLDTDSRSLAIHYFVRKKSFLDRDAVIDEVMFEEGFEHETISFVENITLLSSDNNVYQIATVLNK